MARQCSVCAHPDRTTLDLELARGDGNTAIARRYGLSVGMVRYHKERHLLYLLDPALGLAGEDLAGLTCIRVTSRRTVRKMEPCEVCGIPPDDELWPCTYVALWEAIPQWGAAQEAGLTTHCEECGRRLTGPDLVSDNPLNW